MERKEGRLSAKLESGFGRDGGEVRFVPGLGRYSEEASGYGCHFHEAVFKCFLYAIFKL